MAKVTRKAVEMSMDEIRELIPPSDREGFVIMGCHGNGEVVTIDLMQVEKKAELEELQALPQAQGV